MSLSASLSCLCADMATFSCAETIKLCIIIFFTFGMERPFLGDGVDVGVGAADWAAAEPVGAKRTVGPLARASALAPCEGASECGGVLHQKCVLARLGLNEFGGVPFSFGSKRTSAVCLIRL